MITYENVARANAADYDHISVGPANADHIIDYIKANEIINKANYYVNMLLYFH